ncbi:hypothetical protein FACS1894191_5790 [Clostridia bacterium]|nr:hypothetical protein FACS1894191_5790 [Clostridia bacterium]
MGSGFKVVGAVADKKYLREDEDVAHFEELVLAIRRTHADMIIQTDGEELEATYDMAIKKHLGYMMVPTHDIFLSQRTSLELLGELPAFGVKATTLVGYGRVFKRAFDVVFGVIGLIIASPFMAIIAIIVKISDGGPVLFQQSRLTRFGKMTKVFKFRSMKPKYSGMSPEAAFETMGRPELSIQYRKNGDQLDKDPRVTFFGRFLRKTSLDELPQIFNVLSGKISIVGPRALVPEELKDYADKELILSVKSGMTGLAQVSGRRDISFEERRVLDVFYIQNWSILLDLQIIVKTFWFVLRRRGAK